MTSDPDTAPPSLGRRHRLAHHRAQRALNGRLPPDPAEALRDLADQLDRLRERDPAIAMWDNYAEGGPVAELERRVAGVLGKPAAAMFPSGVMAQQAMLRVWCDRRGSARVALPGLSHLLHHELDGPRLLHGLRFELLGDGAELPTTDDLAGLPGPLGAVLLELPLRDAGHLLPSWAELVELTGAARERGAAVHLDGARLWESQPWFARPLAEIAGCADSVYVSLYKGLGGLAGSVVAGPMDEVDEARAWRTRHGGTLFSMLPYAVAGLRGLDEELPRMGEYHQRAVELASALKDAGFAIAPDPPQSVAFRLLARGSATALHERVVEHLERERVSLTPPWEACDVPGWSWTEITVGPATMQWSVPEAVESLILVLGADTLPR